MVKLVAKLLILSLRQAKPEDGTLLQETMGMLSRARGKLAMLGDSSAARSERRLQLFHS